MYFSRFTTLTTHALLSEFNTSVERGLTDTIAEERLRSVGRNETRTKEIKWWHILLRQFKSAFVYLLLAAVVFSFALREVLDASMILLFVTVNAVLGFYQEFHSEKTAKLLKKYLVQHITVRRNSKNTLIESAFIVPGDILYLEPGNVIPADVRLLENHALVVDESTLTGESAPVKKTDTPRSTPAPDVVTADNICFSGTTIKSGTATGIVIATADNTIFGSVAKLTIETAHVSSFERGIQRFSMYILHLIFGTLIFVFLAHVFFKHGTVPLTDLAIFSIALAVGVIPEALPVVTTFSLSRGALRLAKHGVVVKRLSAIEDLGSIEVLCSDKTGTLTENKMTVADVYGKKRQEVLMYACLGSVAIVERNQTSSDAFDGAICKACSATIRTKASAYRVLLNIPFDPTRRRNSTLVEKNDERMLIVRGAPETIFALTSISKTQKAAAHAWMATQGAHARRVIAIAYKPHQKKTYDKSDEAHGMEFVGLMSFEDPIKKTSRNAVRDARALGIQIKILTGDGPEVAGAVATDVGIISRSSQVITGEAFTALSPEAQRATVESYAVFARVSPEQKYQIIKLLQETHEVGFLGEGINDSPALKIANVALVVQGASHIAQESADIILLGKSLHVIIDGIREGRETFANTIKYIKSTLTSNFGNFYALASASLVVEYLPMLPIQLLLVNLLSDFPMISVATDTVDGADLRSPRTYDVKNITYIATILGLLSTLFDFIFFGLFRHAGEAQLHTNWFIGSILTELVLLFSIRTKGFFFKAKRPSAIVLWLTATAAITTVALPYTFLGQNIFRFSPPSLGTMALIFAVVVVYFIMTEAVKLFYYHRLNQKSAN